MRNDTIYWIVASICVVAFSFLLIYLYQSVGNKPYDYERCYSICKNEGFNTPDYATQSKVMCSCMNCNGTDVGKICSKSVSYYMKDDGTNVRWEK